MKDENSEMQQKIANLESEVKSLKSQLRLEIHQEEKKDAVAFEVNQVQSRQAQNDVLIDLADAVKLEKNVEW